MNEKKRVDLCVNKSIVKLINFGGILINAHAKAGNAAMIGGYLGKSDKFEQAVAKFALTYADQIEKDHNLLLKAICKGKIEALKEE